MTNGTVFLFSDPADDREIAIDGLIPVLPVGSTIEISDGSYSLESIELLIDTRTGGVTMYVELK